MTNYDEYMEFYLRHKKSSEWETVIVHLYGDESGIKWEDNYDASDNAFPTPIVALKDYAYFQQRNGFEVSLF